MDQINQVPAGASGGMPEQNQPLQTPAQPAQQSTPPPTSDSAPPPTPLSQLLLSLQKIQCKTLGRRNRGILIIITGVFGCSENRACLKANWVLLKIFKHTVQITEALGLTINVHIKKKHFSRKRTWKILSPPNHRR